jgi:hypothetical protein
VHYLQHHCSQFIIVGVVRDTPAYSKLQDDQIRLLDVIETVNDTPCHKILLPDMDLQERFEHSVDERESIQLELNRCIALPPVSKPLSVGRLIIVITVTGFIMIVEC